MPRSVASEAAGAAEKGGTSTSAANYRPPSSFENFSEHEIQPHALQSRDFIVAKPTGHRGSDGNMLISRGVAGESLRIMGKAEERWAVVWDILTRGSLNGTSLPYAPISSASSEIQDAAELIKKWRNHVS